MKYICIDEGVIGINFAELLHKYTGYEVIRGVTNDYSFEKIAAKSLLDFSSLFNVRLSNKPIILDKCTKETAQHFKELGIDVVTVCISPNFKSGYDFNYFDSSLDGLNIFARYIADTLRSENKRILINAIDGLKECVESESDLTEAINELASALVDAGYDLN